MVIAAQGMRDRAARNFRRLGNARVANAVRQLCRRGHPLWPFGKTGPYSHFEREFAGSRFRGNPRKTNYRAVSARDGTIVIDGVTVKP